MTPEVHEPSCFRTYGVDPCICYIVRKEREIAVLRFWEHFNGTIKAYVEAITDEKPAD